MDLNLDSLLRELRVVVDGSWRMYVNGVLVCEHPWVFGREGWVSFYAEVPFENLTVWTALEVEP